ncbi:MAG TPA: hypothetical protein VFK89_00430, partial [Actinomycetota bacterium]|nr:hypothetical protein [Actinomycetota bacterium]
PRDGDAGEIADVAARAVREFPFTVVDAGRTWPSGLRADAAVVVVPRNVAGARAAAALLSEREDVPAAVITNRTGRGGEMSRQDLQRIIGRPIALDLPHTPALRDAEDDGRLVTSPFLAWSRRIERLCRAIKRL